MGTTPIFGFRFPEDAAWPDVNTDLKNGLIDVETELNKRATTFLKLVSSTTTDANGFATFTHGAPWTPRAAFSVISQASVSLGVPIAIDSLTATTLRVRFARWDTSGVLASAATGPLALLCVK